MTLQRGKSKEVMEIVPPLKWAGGKRWLVSRYRNLFPETISQYFEPFLGSGAVFFSIRPRHAVLSDTNAELINVYCAIRDRPDLVSRYLAQHQKLHCSEYFYATRDRIPQSEFARAARTIYLNRTCWNGLYRVNLRGKFNVPIGTKCQVLLPSDDFMSLSQALSRNVELIACDFEDVIDRAGRGDFVFVDPPYTVAHNNNGFIKYNESIFSWSDQSRLRDAVERARLRGARLLITNANHVSVRKLYKGLEAFVVRRSGVIAADSLHRGEFEELVIPC